MIVEIEAKFSCDECGTEFFASIDPAIVPAAGWSMFDVAEDAVRGGIGYYDGFDDHPHGAPIGSVDDGRHLCARCTRKNDAEGSP